MAVIGLIFSLIAYGYIALAILCLVLALRLPKTLRAKRAATLCVVVVFGWWPAKKYVSDVQRKNLYEELWAFQNKACSASSPIARLSDKKKISLLIDDSAIIGSFDLGDLLSYMIDRGLSRIELSSSKMSTISSNPRLEYKLPETSNYTALHFENRESSECINLESWAPDTYQHPNSTDNGHTALRNQLLAENVCIALEGIHEPQAEFVLVVDPAKEIIRFGEGRDYRQYDYWVQNRFTGARSDGSAVASWSEKSQQAWPICSHTTIKNSPRQPVWNPDTEVRQSPRAL